MIGSPSLRLVLTSSLVLLGSLGLAGTASAQLRQPVDTVNTSGFGPIPKDPRSLCSSTKVGGSIGCTGTKDQGDYADWGGSNPNTLDNMSLIGLFNWYETDAAGNVLVDFLKDAQTEPATFNPLCSIEGRMVLRGGGCLVDFGWYCADGTPNPEIHPLVTVDDILAYANHANPPYPKNWQNNDDSFLPKVGYEVKGTALSDVANNAAFKACTSKKIGFAVKGNGTKNCLSASSCACTQNKYTERKLNQISSASGEPYIAAVIYPSYVAPGRFYVAVEDLPTSTARFDAPYINHTTAGDETWYADGDFNDFVYIVEGVVCQGGGQLCTVPGRQGICATGVTSCVTDTTQTPTCDPVFQPNTETCNAIDDDCNGAIDDGSDLCPSGFTCYKGSCVTDCALVGEIACQSGYVCVGKICVDAACAQANCGEDQRCVDGQCIGGCEGVVCNAGEQCVAGKCVDLCDAREQAGMPGCPNNFVCQNGACVPNCTCLPCPSQDQECQSDASQTKTFGRCVATGCSDGHCGDKLCVPGGECIEPCNPNPCGADQTCTPAKVYNPTQDKDHQYSCTNPNDPGNGGAGTGGESSVCLGCNDAGSGNNGTAAGPNNGNGTPGSSTGPGVSCGCRMAPAPSGIWGLASVLGLAAMAVRRRTRVARFR